MTKSKRKPVCPPTGPAYDGRCRGRGRPGGSRRGRRKSPQGGRR